MQFYILKSVAITMAFLCNSVYAQDFFEETTTLIQLNQTNKAREKLATYHMSSSFDQAKYEQTVVLLNEAEIIDRIKTFINPGTINFYLRLGVSPKEYFRVNARALPRYADLLKKYPEIKKQLYEAKFSYLDTFKVREECLEELYKSPEWDTIKNLNISFNWYNKNKENEKDVKFTHASKVKSFNVLAVRSWAHWFLNNILNFLTKKLG